VAQSVGQGQRAAVPAFRPHSPRRRGNPRCPATECFDRRGQTAFPCRVDQGKRPTARPSSPAGRLPRWRAVPRQWLAETPRLSRRRCPGFPSATAIPTRHASDWVAGGAPSPSTKADGLAGARSHSAVFGAGAFARDMRRSSRVTVRTLALTRRSACSIRRPDLPPTPWAQLSTTFGRPACANRSRSGTRGFAVPEGIQF